MDDKNINAQNTPQVDIPNFKKDKEEKKKGGVPLPGGGIARSAATNLVKAIGREGGEALVRQGADAAARGFLPQLLSSLGGKVLVTILALAMGGGAMLVIKNAGQSASPQKAANLGAINSTIALPKTTDNTALKYAAKSVKAEARQSPVPTAPAAADNTASNDSGLKNTGSGQTAQAASGGSVEAGAPAAPDALGAAPGAAPMADQMDHGMGKLSSDLGGGGSGGFSASGSSGLKSGKMQQFSTPQKGPGGNGGKLMASKIRQSAAMTSQIGNRGRNFSGGRNLGRLNGMGNLFGTVGKTGSQETQATTMVEGYDGTKNDAPAPVAPGDSGTSAPVNPIGGVSGGGGLGCMKPADDLGIYSDDGRGGCKFTPNFSQSKWDDDIKGIRTDVGIIIGMAAAFTVFFTVMAIASMAGGLATSCSGGIGYWPFWIIAASAILVQAALLMGPLKDLQDRANHIAGMPGVGTAGKNLGKKLADFGQRLQYECMAALAGALIAGFADTVGAEIADAIIALIGGAESADAIATAVSIQQEGKDALNQIAADQNTARANPDKK